jgi:hypothetical protein
MEKAQTKIETTKDDSFVDLYVTYNMSGTAVLQNKDGFVETLAVSTTNDLLLPRVSNPVASLCECSSGSRKTEGPCDSDEILGYFWYVLHPDFYVFDALFKLRVALSVRNPTWWMFEIHVPSKFRPRNNNVCKEIIYEESSISQLFHFATSEYCQSHKSRE